MRLVNTKTQFVVVEFIGRQTIFHDIYLEKVMRESGVQIPHFMKKMFDNQSTVKLGDTDFQKAFKEVYYPFTMDQIKHIWVPDREDSHPLIF